MDALGNPLGVHLTGGEAHDLVGADHLRPEMQAATLIADKAYDAHARVIEPLQAAGKSVVIPPKANRKSPRGSDRHTYKDRHLVENFFAKINNSAPSPRDTTRLPEPSSPPFTSWPASFG